MSFIIKTFDRVGRVGWIKPANARGVHTLGSRGEAERFASPKAAEREIRRMPPTFDEFGLQYEIERTDERE